MLNEPFALGYGITQYSLAANLEGLTHDDSLKSPEEGGNCINWVVGHVLIGRNILFRQLGGDAFLTEEEAMPYQRGAASLKVGDPCIDLARLMTGLEETSAVLMERIKALDDEGLGRSLDPSAFPVQVEKPTLGALLSLLMFHESYHSGQVGILRRLAGKEAVLK